MGIRIVVDGARLAVTEFMKALLVAVIGMTAMACGHGNGDEGVSLVEGAQTALAFAVIVFPILRVLGMREDSDPPPGQ